MSGKHVLKRSHIFLGKSPCFPQAPGWKPPGLMVTLPFVVLLSESCMFGLTPQVRNINTLCLSTEVPSAKRMTGKSPLNVLPDSVEAQ